MSHPLRVRGLKHINTNIEYIVELSHPLRVRGLKPGSGYGGGGGGGSHPLRVRGLKQTLLLIVQLEVLSHPLRVRGLKRPSLPETDRRSSVASFTGAWIETIYCTT